jgi:hypothetical protein
VHPNLTWLSETLWSGTPGVVATLDADPPPGHEVIERYLVLPSARHPRFLISDTSASAVGRALDSYRALRPARIRLARSILAAGLRGRIGRRILGDRLTIAVSRQATHQGLSGALLREQVCRLLELDDGLVFAIGLRHRGPNAKPVIQVFDRDGDPRGYVKLGWNEFTRGLVRTEAAFLRDTPAFSTLRVPALIARIRWRNLEMSITAPLPTHIRRFRPSRSLPPPTTSWEIARSGGMRKAPLGTSTYWNRLRRSLSTMLENAPRNAIEVVGGCVNRIEDRFGDMPLLFGAWHGDWVPWNLAWDEDRLVAWDWEHTGQDVPFGFDVLHFLFQLPFAKKRKTLAASIGEMRRRRPAALDSLDVSSDVQPAITAAYLLELFARYHHAQLAGAGVNTRFFPHILNVLAEAPAS